MLYKNDKSVNDAARQPEGGPAEPGGLSVSSLPLLDNAGWGQSQLQIYAVGLIPEARTGVMPYLVFLKSLHMNEWGCGKFNYNPNIVFSYGKRLWNFWLSTNFSLNLKK